MSVLLLIEPTAHADGILNVNVFILPDDPTVEDYTILQQQNSFIFCCVSRRPKHAQQSPFSTPVFESRDVNVSHSPRARK